MSTPGSWKQTIPVINPTDQVKASVVNRPINALAERTDYLRAVLDGVTAAEFNYIRNVAVSSDANVGNVLYYNTAANQYSPALAKWDESLLNPDGTLKPDEEACVAGILVSKTTSNTGSIVIGGYIREFEGLANLFGTASPVAGAYYLSATTAGQVSQDTPPLALLTLIYEGNGNILLPTVRFEHSTHDHKRYEIDNSLWLEATPANFPDMDIPTGATYGVDLENAPTDVKEIFTLYPGIAAITLVGTAENVPVANYELNQDNLWWMDAASPADLYLWLTAPNSHGPNIVRAIQTETPDSLDISLVNGLATINKKAMTTTTGTVGYTVVKDLTDDNEKKTGYVVERIIIGEGLSMSSSAPVAGQGVVTLGLTEFTEKYIDASTINLNNALEVTVDDIIYTAFPSGRTSSMLATAVSPKWTGTDPLEASVWLWVKGPSTTGSDIPDISAEVLVFPDPSTTPQDIPAVPVSFTISGVLATDSGKYYLLETEEADRFEVTPQSQVQYKLTLDNTETWDILVLRQGIKVYQE